MAKRKIAADLSLDANTSYEHIFKKWEKRKTRSAPVPSQGNKQPGLSAIFSFFFSWKRQRAREKKRAASRARILTVLQAKRHTIIHATRKRPTLHPCWRTEKIARNEFLSAQTYAKEVQPASAVNHLAYKRICICYLVFLFLTQGPMCALHIMYAAALSLHNSSATYQEKKK